MRIDVMQWNVWYKENIDRVVEVIRDLNPDIVCLQELTQGYVEQSQDNTWEHIQRELGYYGVHQTIPITTDSDNWLQANAIFSRYPIVSHKEHWLHTPKDVEDTSDQFRGFLEAVIDLGELQISAGTLHMSFDEREHDSELHELLKATRRKTGHFVLTGDFNATPDSDRMKAVGERFRHAGPDYAQNTWTTKPHDTPAFSASTLDWRYDYVYTTDDIEVIQSRIVQTDVSDHLPIVASLRVPKP